MAGKILVTQVCDTSSRMSDEGPLASSLWLRLLHLVRWHSPSLFSSLIIIINNSTTTTAINISLPPSELFKFCKSRLCSGMLGGITFLTSQSLEPAQAKVDRD
ncbi:hypothetical protein AB1E18_008020 [Capra hircus]